MTQAVIRFPENNGTEPLVKWAEDGRMTYYEILEVSSKASPEVIKNAYRILMKKHHPDNFQNEVDKQIAEERIKKIVKAYEILGDEEKKKAYDCELSSSKIYSKSPAKKNQNKSRKPGRHNWLKWAVGIVGLIFTLFAFMYRIPNSIFVFLLLLIVSYIIWLFYSYFYHKS